MHPGRGIDMQARLALPRGRIVVAPGAKRQPACVMAGAEDENIALAQPNVLGFLDRLQLGPRHRLAGLEPFDLAMARRVQ